MVEEASWNAAQQKLATNQVATDAAPEDVPAPPEMAPAAPETPQPTERSCLCLVVFWGTLIAAALAGVGWQLIETAPSSCCRQATVYAVRKLDKDDCQHGTGMPGGCTWDVIAAR